MNGEVMKLADSSVCDKAAERAFRPLDLVRSINFFLKGIERKKCSSVVRIEYLTCGQSLREIDFATRIQVVGS